MAHTLPALPYAAAALEPHIDALTMTIHHDKHHNAYVTNLNAAIEKAPALANWTLGDLCRNIAQVPEAVRTAVVNKRAGGAGLISGRKAFQKPRKDGVELLNAIQDVYLTKEITIA